ncbi:hypothetical protein SDC9_197018 [bioreactor metagenome]|uniref:Uncharacterized protein n=1 Tax=bioreactor metagenome TaxID=1076179 RepID=A0A645IDR9_9ZZZZ
MVLIELDDAVGSRIGNPIGEDRCTVHVAVFGELLAEPRPVEDVVSENKRTFVPSHEVSADGESLR